MPIIIEIHKLVSHLSTEERLHIFTSVRTICGDGIDQTPTTMVSQPVPPSNDFGTLPPKAARWLTQNKIPMERIEEFFHINGEVELLSIEMPGRSKREQTTNCYLMVGIRSLLATGEPSVNELEVVSLCKKHKCHDATNHATYRKQTANYLAGDKDRGFFLSTPGLRAAAEMIRTAD